MSPSVIRSVAPAIIASVVQPSSTACSRPSIKWSQTQTESKPSRSASPRGAQHGAGIERGDARRAKQVRAGEGESGTQ